MLKDGWRSMVVVTFQLPYKSGGPYRRILARGEGKAANKKEGTSSAEKV